MEAILMVFLMIGLILCCNEGDWFPWLNFVGLAIATVAMLLINKRDNRRWFK